LLSIPGLPPAARNASVAGAPVNVRQVASAAESAAIVMLLELLVVVPAAAARASTTFAVKVNGPEPTIE
jgi:hypothetical protein